MLSLGCHVDFILMLKKRVIIISKLEYDLLADSSDTGSVHTRVCIYVYVCVCGRGRGGEGGCTYYLYAQTVTICTILEKWCFTRFIKEGFAI